MPFLCVADSILSGRLLFVDELTGAVALSSAAMWTLLPTRRSGEHVKKGSQGTLQSIVKFLHSGDDTAKSRSCKAFLLFLFRLQLFVTWLKARKYFET